MTIAEIHEQRVILRLAFAILLLWLFAPVALGPAVHAGAPGSATVSIVPADGKARGIQVRAQTVDTLIKQDADGVWADTRVWVLLYNPSKQPVVVPIALPGPQLGATGLPAILEVTLNDRPLALQPLSATPGGPVIRQTAPITVPMRGSTALRVRYRQALAEQEGLVTYSYPLTATLRWAGTPESLRVTVKFDPPAVPEQMLGYAPATKRQDRDGLTWHLENQRAAQSIAIAFMAPAWWAEFRAARTAAAAPAAGLAAQMALSRYYRRLAALPPLPFEPQTNYDDRYYPAEVAALRAAVVAPAAAATPGEQAAAHVRLAEIYWELDQRLGDDGGHAYRQMAAFELQAAAALDTADTGLRVAAADLFARMAGDAQNRGDQVMAAQHRARAAALRVPNGAASDRELTEAAILVQATQAVEAGDVSLARRLVTTTFGPEVITLAGAPPPRATQALLTVTTSPGQRTFVLRLAGNGETVLATLLAQTAEALAIEPTAQAVAAGDQLTVTLAYTEAGRLAEPQARLVAALPPAPELALLAAALTPRGLTWAVRQGWFSLTERYVEQVDLEPARQSWEAYAGRLEAAARGSAAGEAVSDDERIARLQQAFWTADANAWRMLAAESRATYRAELNWSGTTRQWEVRPGEDRVLETVMSRVRIERYAAVAAAAVLLVLCLAAVAWRWS